MLRDYIVMALRNIERRRARSVITLIGIFIGIAAVVALISLSQGMQDAINAQFNKIGQNRLIIVPGGRFMGPTGGDLSTATLTDKDIKAIKRVKEVDFAAGLLTENARVEYKDEAKYISVWGIPTDGESLRYFDGISFFEVEKGRSFKSSDAKSAVVGYRIAHDRFSRDIVLGSKIAINNATFDVVGLQKNAGTGVHDVIIRIPLDEARTLFKEDEKITSIFASTQIGKDPLQVAEKVKKELRRSRNVKEGEEDFTVQTSAQSIAIFNAILNLVKAILVGIAAISLLVGGIGIMNTMYTSVMERMDEIGIMKSIGARNSDILLVFLIESCALGIVGGIIGVIVGMSISGMVQLIATLSGFMLLDINTSPYLIFGAIAFSAIIGALSGFLPALEASRLRPVDALKK
ncbi:ABC transporter permease [Candidatus Woesearchaeota archaeon]|nr:MAG: hypothetical protein QS99_C0012G0072 [archaeon GW2011_AR4]MBS3130601.1 ABC transporter permease [Candidatus Woesearchaeota archaeon]HIH39055.1 FtsX-like permease family protein [Candidatus Woesearchaeota archaeon]HIH48260.1 FtsX-like permease family protein [Candidatus Woesearchaeota archaeon]HIJ03822.1 FtsX-like permease family protein [Candidatus Woesearchaeota archaeon]